MTELKNMQSLTATQFRTDISSHMDRANQSPYQGIEVTRNNKTCGYYLGNEYRELVDAVVNKNPPQVLAEMILFRWLGERSPSHLREAQRNELLTVRLLGLAKLVEIDPSQDEESLKSLCDDEYLDEKIIDRLIKRRKIATAVLEAEAEGLY